MAGRRVHFVFPVGLIERVDAVLGAGQSRGEFVRGAVERALCDRVAVERALELRRGSGLAEAAKGLASEREMDTVAPAPVEQPVGRLRGCRARQASSEAEEPFAREQADPGLRSLGEGRSAAPAGRPEAPDFIREGGMAPASSYRSREFRPYPKGGK